MPRGPLSLRVTDGDDGDEALAGALLMPAEDGGDGYVCQRCQRDQCERCTDRDCRCCAGGAED